ncbi:MAG: histidinol-phosphatase HisJ family protein [Syntrophomonadaceae bacterium]|nr:histidinol-phosphatase HisJ family protein [Syntrophomonadaceae bacterium]MDD3888958.1 histidinol-phosphatase HisJ family protein [Syntrophomonadaceae bacterium]MDD4548684.1 histidinol-phosphatase HisJ family protein [Syntrophomonadaceae bacterium]
MLDYHVHAVAHGEYEYTYEWILRFLENARERKVTEIGFTEHDEYRAQVKDDVLSSLQGEFSDLIIRTGLEVDFIPGREQEIHRIISEKQYDYIIGSVHFIDQWPFDHPDFKDQFDDYDVDEVYKNYFMLVDKAVNSGFFDIVGHIDLVKIWGHRPSKHNAIYYVKPVLASVKKMGMAIEINSAGLRKPVKEIYPAQEILETMYAMNIPITLGSDAHHPTQVGEGLEEACMLAKKIGYRKLVQFRRHIKKAISV